MESNSKVKEDECFADFNYTDPDFACTLEQVEQFNAILQNKLMKERKKRLLKERRDAERAEKILQESDVKEISH